MFTIFFIAMVWILGTIIVIRQIIQKNREPVEGWGYLNGIAIFKKHSFTIMPEVIADAFGPEVYTTRRTVRLEGAIQNGTAYGWVQALTLPTRETVEEAIQMLYEELQERKNAG